MEPKYILGPTVEIPIPEEWKSGETFEPVTLVVTEIDLENKTITLSSPPKSK